MQVHIVLSALGTIIFCAGALFGGNRVSEYKVLPPVTKGNLSIFPVVGPSHTESVRLITLDEGIRSGEVVVTEAGALRGLIRGPITGPVPGGDQVNRLVLVNNSGSPLLLLAGEVVTGGKQDRVIASDRIVPAKSDPVDLSVFCVEPGRWVAQTAKFTSASSFMAQPSVRSPAMAESNQQSVWASVGGARSAMAAAAPTAAPTVNATTSYATAMQAPEVQRKIASVASDYDSILHELHKVGAMGVVVAVNRKILWADLFANSELLENYWQKLIRSYVAESLTSAGSESKVEQEEAQQFLEKLGGNREVIETDPGVFRRSEVSGDGYKVFTLTSLMGKSDVTIHAAKMAYEGKARPQGFRDIFVR